MKESDHQNQDAPLSYRGARRIVWLIFLLVIAWFVLRSLQSMVLLFAIVFLLAMVLNPIVVWLRKHHVPRLASVILLMLTLVTVTEQSSSLRFLHWPDKARNWCRVRRRFGRAFVYA